MAPGNSFSLKNVDQTPLIDIVLLHGLTGDPLETWSSGAGGAFWPNWLAEDLGNLNVYTAGYEASMFSQWAKKEMDLFERAGNLLEYMAGLGLGNRPIAFITHSLGGILVKLLLRRASSSSDADYRRIAESTKLVVFLATPHLGASLASVLDLLPCTSSHIKLLANDTGVLEDINQQYRTYAGQRPDLQTVAYYEKIPIKGVLIVSRQSADPGLTNTQPTALDKDHINICKPVDREDVVYLCLKRHIDNLRDSILSILPNGGAGNLGNGYSVRSETDRRDLLQKLIDAGREYEYGIANERQNKFAQRLAKTGLFTSAKNDHEQLLDEVETRFVVHVYHPLICKTASDEEIAKALQDHVITPIANTQIGGTKFSMKDVHSALYYLTEQCHVRWDAPK